MKQEVFTNEFGRKYPNIAEWVENGIGFGGGIAGGNAMILSMTKECNEFVEKKRAQILSGLEKFVRRNRHPMTAGEIVELVFYDEWEEDDFESYVMLLTDDDPEQADVVQEITMELFNYFPRKTLGGKSFAEKMSFDELQKMEKAWEEGSAYSFAPSKELWK